MGNRNENNCHFWNFEHLSTLGSQESVVTIELIHILDRVRVLTVFEKKKKSSEYICLFDNQEQV